MTHLLKKPLTRFDLKGMITRWSRQLSAPAYDDFDQPESWKSMEGLVRCSANCVPLSPISFLERSANVYRDRTSVVYGSVKYTWEQTHARCVQLASSLAQLGISCGHVVATMAPNIPAMLELHFAVPMAGGVLCNLNTRHDARMVSVLLRHSEAKIIFVDHLLLDIAQEALHLLKNTAAQVPLLVSILEPDRSSSPPSSNFHIYVYESLVAGGVKDFPIRRPKNEWDPISINYTSGTTSQPKGVVYSHRGAYLNSIATIFQHGMGASATPTPTYLWTVPMFHCHGWGLVSGLAAIGGTNVCLRRVRPKDIFDNIARHKVTHMGGAPTVLNMIVNSPESLRKPFHHKVEIMTASTSPPPQIISKMEDLGFVVSHLYGLTETHGPVTSCIWKPEWDSLPKEERLKLKARQGVKHIAAEEVKVKDSVTMETVPADGETIGEVMIRGNTVMSGYLKNPKATKEALKGGWFHTGDLAVMHTDGYIEIKDRLKDIIISGGENISSVEVESVIYSHPAVLEAAVVARPDEHWGQTVCAFVKLKDGFDGVDEEEIIKYCRDKMPHFMAPKSVVFEDLQATSTGKIQKFLLREKAESLGSLSSPLFLERVVDSS